MSSDNISTNKDARLTGLVRVIDIEQCQVVSIRVCKLCSCSIRLLTLRVRAHKNVRHWKSHVKPSADRQKSAHSSMEP